eukprot:CAMPEP_0114620886 /NCGR_PEP_ID=MMETSP0168-20121206/8952_1 /TAXON_ID=95228 ORGANISM="Vannella sp., Strain DIVA3 517/6/12" /NCGR_SAMPLE_ID=MMETSP0168 /ASSEMBLY_ACC=CAM_ASM_000044 /LENGTH=1105 /DNA_ID=CAMNT_0001832083 /DNA_START=33 /DNA_END=3346 /DNA_ORIENTATION=+
MDSGSDCNIRVICRFRPVNARERAEGADAATEHLQFVDDKMIKVGEFQGRQPQHFTFDKVFHSPDTTQEEVYGLAARASIDDVINGYNSTIFAYGQTGAGKSFTMFGADLIQENLKGIIPRACKHIFNHIAEDTVGTEYTIKCSFLEIYKEVVRDLLNPASNTSKSGLRIRETPDKGVWVDGLQEEYVTCEDDVLQLLLRGEQFRATSSTDMNATSSRSHSLFILTLHQKSPDGSTKEGKLNLADLAGSEKIRKTGATGNTLEEAKKINQSLSALGNCINALTKQGGKRKVHVPYRDSKLTFILRESLGGNCKTTLLIACSPHVFNLEETVSTLQFGKRAKTIKNVVSKNEQRSVAELMAIIERLKKELAYFKRYSRILEQELEKAVGPEWRENLPKLPTRASAAAPPQSAPALHAEGEGEGEDEDEDSFLSSDKGGGSVPLLDMGSPGPVDSPGGVAMTPRTEAREYLGDSSVRVAQLQVELDRLKESSAMEINGLQYEARQARDDSNTAEAKLAEKKAMLREAEVTMKELNAELETVTEAKKLAESKAEYAMQEAALQLQQQTEKADSLLASNAELKARADGLNSDLEAAVSEKESLQVALESKNRELGELQASFAERTAHAASADAQVEALEAEHKQIRAERLETELKVKQVKQQLEQLQGHHEAALAKCKEAEQRARTAEHSGAELAENLSEATAKISALEEALDEAREELARSERVEAEMKAQGEQMEELKRETVAMHQFERAQKEAEKLKSALSQATDALKSERERQKALVEEAELAREAHAVDLERTAQLHEVQLNASNVQIEVLEARLSESEHNAERTKNLFEEKLKASEAKFASEKSLRQQAEEGRAELSAQILEKDKNLRHVRGELEEAEREVKQLQKEKENQAKTLEAQAGRIKRLEEEAEKAEADKKQLQQELNTALEINLENARQFERQLQAVEEPVVNPLQQVRPREARSPILALLGFKSLPLLNELRDPVKYGFLLKRSAWLRRWEKRWVVLHGGSLYYFENNHQSSKASLEVELEGCKVIAAGEFTGKPNTLAVLHQSRRDFYFQAESEQEQKEWLSAIRSVVSLLANQTASPAKPPPRGGNIRKPVSG